MKIRVLVVDDLSFMRDAIRGILESGGITVVGEARTGREGIAAMEATKPDIIILDITMPEMDGLTALTHMKERNSKVKVIMCSAIGQQKAIIKAIQLGAVDFIVKPFKAESLVSAVLKAALRE